MYSDVFDKIRQLKNGIAYCDSALIHNIEEWERKEYKALKKSYEEELKKSESYVKEHNLKPSKRSC